MDGDSLAHTKLTQLCTQDSDSLARTKVSQLYTRSLRGIGWGLVNVIIFLAVQQTQALLIHDQLPVGWGGARQKRSCSCAHTGSATSSSFLLFCRHRHCSFMISYGWGGVGRGNDVHVPVHTQAQQPHHLSYCPADTGTAHSWSVTGGVGWGGVITFTFLCAHRHRNLIIFLAVQQTRALLIHDQLPVGWVGLGWGNNVHVPVHTQAQQPYHHHHHHHHHLAITIIITIIIIIITVITIIRT